METENDDHDDTREESASKKARHGSKSAGSKGSRCRLTWKQKAQAVQHYDTTVPKLKHEQLGEWCKKTFKLQQAPGKCAVGKWLKPETKSRLLYKLETEISAHVQQQKALYEPKYPQLEAKLTEWFLTQQTNQAILMDDAIRDQALKFAEGLNLVNFRASSNWITKFKKRHGIKQYATHGESGSADKVNVVIGQEFCLEFFKDVSAVTHCG